MLILEKSQANQNELVPSSESGSISREEYYWVLSSQMHNLPVNGDNSSPPALAMRCAHCFHLLGWGAYWFFHGLGTSIVFSEVITGAACFLAPQRLVT